MSLAMALIGGSLAGPAGATNRSTLDPQAVSFGPIVTDAVGNGYVAWNHKGSPDVPMFCKIPPGGKCASPISLSLPGGTSVDAAADVFPVFGAGSIVYVVAPRSARNDTVFWTSNDGGATFGGPTVIPYGSYAGKTTVDDVLRNSAQYVTSQGQIGNVFLVGSDNPGLGFNFVYNTQTAGTTSFTFANPGMGGVAGATLGLDVSGNPVEVYSLLSSPSTVDFYRYGGSGPIDNGQSWSGPGLVTNGYLPRLAGGPAGLFLLSRDYVRGGTIPSSVDVRKYDPVNHVFGPPTTIITDPQNQALQFDGGGLFENPDTGELVVAWPGSLANGGASVMRLWTSSDGGRSFAPEQDVAAIAGGYAINDNARLAVTDTGHGFLTFRDSAGLELVDLNLTKHATGGPAGVPVLGKSVSAAVVSGQVFVLLPGTGHLPPAGGKGVGFVPLTQARVLPAGTIFDTTVGVVRLKSAVNSGGTLQSGDFGAGVFKVLQNRRDRGLTELRLVVGRSANQSCTMRARTAAARPLPSRVLNLLRANAKGRFRTRGRYSSATVRGTIWETSDRCDGTLTRVRRGVVLVRDFRLHRQIVLRAGKSYLAKAP